MQQSRETWQPRGGDRVIERMELRRTLLEFQPKEQTA